MDRAEIERRVVTAISAAFALNEVAITDPSFKVSDAGTFSSYSLLELIIRLEEAFGIEIPDADLDRDRFDTVHSIADYAEARLGV